MCKSRLLLLLLNDMSVYQSGVFERAPWNGLFYRVFDQNLVFVLWPSWFLKDATLLLSSHPFWYWMSGRMTSVYTEEFQWAWNDFVNRKLVKSWKTRTSEYLCVEKNNAFGWLFASKFDRRVERVSDINKNGNFFHSNVPVERKCVIDESLPNRRF